MRPRAVLRATFSAGLGVFGVGFVVWAALALWVDGPEARWLTGLLVAALLLAVAATLWRVRPLRRALRWVPLAPLAVLAWWLSLNPSNDRDWEPGQARLAHATVEGDRLIVRNVRNFHYRSADDFDPNWETRTYDLREIVGYDMFLSFWGPTLYGHTISSWEFADGSTLAISIETRRERGEGYSPLSSLFRQFELYYVVGDERDLVGLRTRHLGERVYLYRVRGRPQAAREGLMEFIHTINELAERPAWYNVLTTNCTTSIWHHAKRLNSRETWDWRILLNGYLDELGYETGAINRDLPFVRMKALSDITGRARAAPAAADFSAAIREGLPPRPPPKVR